MSNRILSYRGLLADGGQDTILLSTKKGEVGYRITKLQVLSNDLNTNLESTVKIYSKEPSTIDELVDFSDTTLLGTATFNQASQNYYNPGTVIIFDSLIFNQDIFVTNKCSDAVGPINYYLELEIIKLDESQAMVATLKDIRNNS